MQTSEYFFGRNGAVQVQVSDLSTIHPEVTLDLGRLQVKPVSQPMYKSDVVGKKIFIAKQYRAWGRFGINGDLIKIDRIPVPNSDKVSWKIDFIGRLDRPRPILAVDVVPIVYTCMADAHWVLIKRKFNPGQGKIALIGGHQEIRDFHLQTPAEAIQMELEEEAGLQIVPRSAPTFYHRPMTTHLRVEVMLEPGLSITSELQLIGTFETSDEERVPHLGRKRVDWTTAYFLPIYLGGGAPMLGPLKFDRWFKAGDDAKELVYLNCRSAIKEPRCPIDFGIPHHRTIFDRATEMFQALPMHTFPMRIDID